jgi:hypothetical protein
MTFIERLIAENQILVNSGLSQFQIYRNSDGVSYSLSGTQSTSVGKTYMLSSPIPSGFPEARPPVYITSPNPLPAFTYGDTINRYGTSHDMHTLSNGANGATQICHWRDNRWHSGITLNKVMLKAIIWLEAYEQHLSTGEPIANFVATMADK